MRDQLLASLVMGLLDAFALPWATRLVHWWVALYTGGLPTQVADRRCLEIESDLHDHQVTLLADGYAPRSIAVHILYRCVRGMPSDLAWRFGDARELVLSHHAKINYSLVGAISAASDRRVYYQRNWESVLGQSSRPVSQRAPYRTRQRDPGAPAYEPGYIPTPWRRRTMIWREVHFR